MLFGEFGKQVLPLLFKFIDLIDDIDACPYRAALGEVAQPLVLVFQLLRDVFEGLFDEGPYVIGLLVLLPFILH